MLCASANLPLICFYIYIYISRIIYTVRDKYTICPVLIMEITKDKAALFWKALSAHPNHSSTSKDARLIRNY